MWLPAAEQPVQPPSPPDSRIQRIAEVERAVDQSSTAVADIPSRADFDRSRIALIVMSVYAGVLGLVLLLLIVRGCQNTEQWGDVTKEAGDLIKTAILPIVTLILGYYFGKSGRL